MGKRGKIQQKDTRNPKRKRRHHHDNDDEATKIVRVQKFLQAKFGGVKDEIHDKENGDEKEEKVLWGRNHYGGDDEAPLEEDKEILRMQMKKAKQFSIEDFIPEDVIDEIDTEKKHNL